MPAFVRGLTYSIRHRLRDVLPILHKPTPEVVAAAAAAYHCKLQPDVMTKHEALAEIDHLMERRLAARGAPGAK